MVGRGAQGEREVLAQLAHGGLAYSESADIAGVSFFLVVGELFVPDQARARPAQAATKRCASSRTAAAVLPGL